MTERDPLPTVQEKLRAAVAELDKHRGRGPIDTGAPPPDDPDMLERLAKLETRLETILPTLATKADVSDAKDTLRVWIVGTALVGAGIVIAWISATKPSPAPAAPQPIIIQVPVPTAAPPPASPAPK